MVKERQAEYKPLSFSTTMRNPLRIMGFLNCLLPFEGKVLNNDVINKVVSSLIANKLYSTMYEKSHTTYKEILNGEDKTFSNDQIEDIIRNSPQDHKEAGFERGWPSRFDTWYKLPMEFGFIQYEIGQPIKFSTTGHMLIDAYNEVPINEEKIKDVFLNALIKYQTNNPYRKNANKNIPLLLLMQVISLLKKDDKENGAGITRGEVSLIICWPNNDALEVYKKIKFLRQKYGFGYTDEIIYDCCLELLQADSSKKTRFKISQITGEAVDEFIRKMRITGIISLRGQGRFLDFNSFEQATIKYILEHYTGDTKSFTSKDEYFQYMGKIDSNIVSINPSVDIAQIDDVRDKMLNYWVEHYSKENIFSELEIINNNRESKNSILRLIDKPTRLEFLVSIAIKQNFDDIIVHPNYRVDDEGLPTFTASGGMADIECFDTDSNPLIEVTLMSSRSQSTNEIPAITRHLNEAIKKYPEKIVFTVFVAPKIHADTKYMVEFSKFRYDIDIIPFDMHTFISKISEAQKIVDLLYD